MNLRSAFLSCVIFALAVRGAFLPHFAWAQEAPVKPLPPVTDRVALDLLATNPTEPANMARVINSLIDLRQAQAAVPLLTRLTSMELDDAALLAFFREYGSATLIKWSAQPVLKTIADPFQQRVTEAVARMLADPEQIGRRVTDLASPSMLVRRQAGEELASGGPTAAQALVAVLSDESHAGSRPAIISVLVALGQSALPELLKARSAENVPTRSAVLEALARLPGSDGKLLVLSTAFSTNEKDATVRATAKRLVASLYGAEFGASQAAAMLYSRGSELLASAGNLQLAEILVRDGLAIQPDNGYLRRACIAIVANQKNSQSFESFNEFDVATFEAALDSALQLDDVMTASFALAYLGRNGSESLLHSRDPRPSLLVEATRSRDARIRWSAVQAIAAIKPVEPFDGSSYVVDAVEYALLGRGHQQALVIDGRSAVARSRAGLLMSQGYEGEIATDHRSALEVATHLPDCELIVIDISMAAERSGQLISALRRDIRTANLPIGIVAPTDRYDEALQIARKFPLTVGLIDAPTVQAAQFWVRSLRELPGNKFVDAKVRRSQASDALRWLAETGLATPQVYSLGRCEQPVLHALSTGQLRPLALPVASRFNSPVMQSSLVALASNPLQTAESRAAALAAAADSISRFGLLLTAVQLQEQYDRFNSLAPTDAAGRKSLGAVLDMIEARAAFDRARGPLSPSAAGALRSTATPTNVGAQASNSR